MLSWSENLVYGYIKLDRRQIFLIIDEYLNHK